MSKSYLFLVVLASVIVVATAVSLQRCMRAEPEARDHADTSVETMAPTHTALPTPMPPKPNPLASETREPGANVAYALKSVGRSAPMLAPYGHIDGLSLRVNQPVTAPSEVVRGLAVGDDAVYMSTTVPGGSTAMLYRLRRDLLTILQQQDLTQGVHTHIGGLHLGGDALWVPVADGVVSTPSRGSTRILALDPQSLEQRRGFVVADQITLVVQAPSGRLVGFNDEGTQAYEWTVDGQEVRRRPLTTGAVYRDAEVIGGNLVCAGTDMQGGLLDVLDPDSLTLVERHRCQGAEQLDSYLTEYGFGVTPRLDSGVNEGRAPIFYFALPGERTPMLLSYVLDGVPLEQWLPITQPSGTP
jgi:hypothetical protein